MNLYTVRIEHVLLLAMCSVLSFANWRINKGAKGMNWFFVYGLACTLGTALSALRGHLPLFCATVLPIVFILTGYFSLFLSLSDLTGRGRPALFFQVCLLAIGIASALQYGLVHPDTQRRWVVFALVMGMQQAQTAWLLHRQRSKALRAASVPLVCILACLVFANLAGLPGLLLYASRGNQALQDIAMIWVEVFKTCLQCCTVVSYIWITASLLHHDLEVQATTDPLTGLLNRRAIERLAVNVLAAEYQPSAQVWVILMDLDGFKQINDTLGHGCGDETLVSVAQCLRTGVRKNDLIARLGGDEFAVLLPRTSMQMATEIAERLLLSIAELEIPWDQASARVTASIGLSQAHRAITDWDHLVTNCDNAMYAAKRAGGNRIVCLAQPLLQEQALESARNAYGVSPNHTQTLRS